MGQAKQRGSFEVRKEQSIERNKVRAHELHQRLLKIEESLTPEEKAKRLRVAHLMASIAPFIGAR